MRVLVTGGAGYIGSVTSAHLLAAGHDVIVLDDFSSGHGSAVPRGAEVAELDLLDAGALAGALRGVDAVVHFAAKALVGESMKHPELYWRTNAVGSLNLLEAMREAGVGRIVVSSTCAVYGEPEEQPITEETPTRPISAYGASKLAVDLMLSGVAAAHGLAAASLRYFNVAGADRGLGEHHDPETHLVPLVLRTAAGLSPSVNVNGTDFPTRDGTAVRDYVHVRDLAIAHLRALEVLEEGRHHVVNLGTGVGFSVLEVIDAARRVTDRPIQVLEAPPRPGDPPTLVASNARARELLGWEPVESLERMIADAWELMLASPGMPVA